MSFSNYTGIKKNENVIDIQNNGNEYNIIILQTLTIISKEIQTYPKIHLDI